MTRPCGRSVSLRAHLQDRFVVLFPTATLDRLTLGFGSQHCLGLRLSLRLRLHFGFRTRALFRAAHVGSEQYLGEQALPHTRPSRPRPACAGYPVCCPLCSVCLNYLSNCFVDERTEVGEVHLAHPRSYGGVLLSRLRRVENSSLPAARRSSC